MVEPGSKGQVAFVGAATHGPPHIVQYFGRAYTLLSTSVSADL